MLNKYQYVYNNPHKYNDEDGHCPTCKPKPAAIAPLSIPVIAGALAYILANPSETGPRKRQTNRHIAADLFGVLPIPGSKYAGGLVSRFILKGSGNAAVKKVIEVSAKKYPQSAKHIKDAQPSKKPSVLTVDRKNAAKNRREATKNTKTEKGKDRDEYPPAFAKEGGKGASVRSINRGDNRGAGALMGRQLDGVKDGEKVRIKVID